MRKTDSDALPRWMSNVLKLAGAYNLLWGALVVLFPLAPFRWAAMAEPNYPQLWQCIGMIVGVYGIGYWIAASDPCRHWPIVLVGFLGKILGPIGFLDAALRGELPWVAGWVNVFNDLIWWLPFTGILTWVYAVHQAPEAAAEFSSLKEALDRSVASTGESLAAISDRAPSMVVFVRHAGCTFCREAAADLAARRSQIESRGTQIVLVHLGNSKQGAEFFGKYGLADLPQISDPGRALYNAFELRRGTFWQLMSPAVWWRGFQACMVGGHGVGRLEGDGTQMPGIFLVHRGRILKAFRNQTVADRPDYLQMAACEVPG